VQLGRDIATIDLLTRSEPDDAAERRRWWGAGLDPRRPHDVVVVGGDPERARRFVAALGLGERLASAVHQDQLVVVVPTELDVQSRWVGEDAPAAGLTGPVAEPSSLRTAHAEASRTARAMAALGRSGTMARAADLGVFSVLLSRTGRVELRDQMERELGAVLAEESARGVPLTETLEAFLEHGRRPTATASALHVHVNTVYQRLSTLDRLLGSGWRDRSLELQVLLRLRRASDVLDG
jgi:sugar diacid utilization regulator